jgi:hypothetical protein
MTLCIPSEAELRRVCNANAADILKSLTQYHGMKYARLQQIARKAKANKTTPITTTTRGQRQAAPDTINLFYQLCCATGGQLRARWSPKRALLATLRSFSR